MLAMDLNGNLAIDARHKIMDASQDTWCGDDA
jgi:hypothetical protein